MNIADVIAYIEKTAPLNIAASWDHSGLQVASYRENISCLAVCLDPLPQTIRVAFESGADMVLAHHPLTMKPRFTDKRDSYLATLSLLLKGDVPLYSAHTSLDANPTGPVAWLARVLDLLPPLTEGETEHGVILPVLEPVGRIKKDDYEIECGFGVVGDLPVVISQDEFWHVLFPWIKNTGAHLAGNLPAHLQRIAICPGSGADLAEAAAQWKADILITGDLKYHAALESSIPILDVGHFSLEEEMMRRFARELGEGLQDISVVFIPSHDPLKPFFLVAG